MAALLRPSSIMLRRVQLLLLASAAALAEEGSKQKCARHGSRSLCMAFRLQDLCAWDVESAACTEETPCEKRSVDRCEYELTTGGAPWDRTTNKCFVDRKRHACRWTDECLTAAHGRPDPAGSCAAAGCQWTRFCKAPSMRLPLPGLHPRKSWCVHKCAPPGIRGGQPAAAAAPAAAPAADDAAKKERAASPLPPAAAPPPPSPAAKADAGDESYASYGSYSYGGNGTCASAGA